MTGRVGMAIVGAALLGAAACDPGPSPERPAEVPPPLTTLSGVVFEGYGDGERSFEVRAERAVIEPTLAQARLIDVQIAFTQEQRGPVDVRAGEALFELGRDDFVLRGGVEGTTGQGERFWTDEVRYEQSRRMLVTDAPVRLERSSLEFVGQGMEIDLDARTIRFVGSVDATVSPR